MAIKATHLRQNLYQILDKIINTGQIVEIERKGHILKIIPEKKKSKFLGLEKHQIVSGNSDELISLDWSKYWEDKIE